MNKKRITALLTLLAVALPSFAWATACEDALMGVGIAPAAAEQICTLSPASITLSSTLTAEQITSTDDATIADAITADDFLPDANGGGHLGSAASRFDSLYLGNATATFNCAYSTNTMQCGSVTAHDWQLLGQNAVVATVSSGSITMSAEKFLKSSIGTLSAAGSNQGSATAVVSQVNSVDSSDDAKGIILPATPSVGQVTTVCNSVASKKLLVYPSSGAAINGGSANAAVPLYGKQCMLCAYTASNVYNCGVMGNPAVKTLFTPAGNGRAGTTGGWTNTGTNMNEALLPASQSGSTFTIPIQGLQIGDTVESFKVIAQIESAGGTVTLDADLRTLTNAAADPADASIGAITQVSVTADTAVASSKTLSTASLVASGTSYYVLLTGTTAGSTDVRLLGVEAVVRREN